MGYRQPPRVCGVIWIVSFFLELSKPRVWAVLLLGALGTASWHAHADIYECEEPGRQKRFTNIKAEAKGCKLLTVTPVVVSPPPPSGAAAPAPTTRSDARPMNPGGASPDGFPKVAPQVQQQRDTDRRKILEAELINKQKNLQDARRELAEQENQRLGGERNPVRMQERIEPYARKVKLHEDNIANLQRELAAIR